MDAILNGWYFTWVIIPLLIFFARIMDVSIGTLRLIFIARGYKLIAPLLGFFEILIWLAAIRQIMQQLDNPVCFVAYAFGFAAGNFIGMWISEKLSIGKVLLRTIPRESGNEIANDLRASGYGVSVVDAEGKTGNVKIIVTILNRKDLPHALHIVKSHCPSAFYSIEEVQTAGEGYFKHHRSVFYPLISPFPFARKGK